MATCTTTQRSVCGSGQTTTCTNAQTFCGAGYQTVEKFSSLKLTNTVNAGNQLDDATWNTVRSKLEAITNLGTYGTKNGNILPHNGSVVTSNYFSQVNAGSAISRAEYNNLLTKLGQTNLGSGRLYYASDWNSLISWLNAYTLNTNRCDVCNAGCQTTCQLSSQCNNDCGVCHAGGQGCGGADGCVAGEGSARELKENINDFVLNATNLIKDIDIVDFNYKADEEKNLKIGFIADDTNELFATKNHDKMDMYNCIGLLLKAVQELNQRLDRLEYINGEIQ